MVGVGAARFSREVSGANAVDWFLLERLKSISWLSGFSVCRAEISPNIYVIWLHHTQLGDFYVEYRDFQFNDTMHH